MDAPLADSAETQHLLEQARAGRRAAVEQLFARHRSYLRQVVHLRLDPKLRPRLDASDIVQEAQAEAVRRLDRYLEQPPLPFRLWLRQLALDRLRTLRRHHVAAARRTVDRDQRLPDRSSRVLAQQLVSRGLTPSEHLVQHELVRRVRQALGRLAESDREMLLMRHVEGLSNQEVAGVLALTPAAASQRYGRALLRLRKVLLDQGILESEP